MSVLEIESCNEKRILIPKEFIPEFIPTIPSSKSEIRQVYFLKVVSPNVDEPVQIRILKLERDIVKSEYPLEISNANDLDCLELKFKGSCSRSKISNGLKVIIDSDKPISLSVYFNDLLKLKYNGKIVKLFELDSIAQRSPIEIRIYSISLPQLEAENAARELGLSVIGMIDDPRTPFLIDNLNRMNGKYLFKSFFDRSPISFVIGKSKTKRIEKTKDDKLDLTHSDRIYRFLELPKPVLVDDLDLKMEQESVEYLIHKWQSI